MRYSNLKQKKGKEYSVWNNMKYIVGIALKVQKSIIIYCILNSVITIILKNERTMSLWKMLEERIKISRKKEINKSKIITAFNPLTI